MNAREILIYFNKICRGNFQMMYNKIKDKEPAATNADKQVKNLIDEMNQSGYTAITLIDENYPTALKVMQRPPMVIYASGDLSLLNTKGIGVIGDDEEFDSREAKGESVFVFLGTEQIELVNYITGQKLFIRINQCGEPEADDLITLFCGFCKALIVYNATDTDINLKVVNTIIQYSFSPIKFYVDNNCSKLFSLCCYGNNYTTVADLEKELKELEGDFEI